MLKLNGRDVEAKGTVLETCRAAGVHVPTMCHSERVHAGGHCRACIVEVNGRAVPACTTPARDGVAIETDTPRLQAYRRDLGELMLTEATPRETVREQLKAWGVTGGRYVESATRSKLRDATHPYLRIDLEACIKCRLCESACDEIQGQFVYGFVGRGRETKLGWGTGDFAETDCVSCGACASLCPSGALSDRDRERARTVPEPSRTPVRTTCSYCGVGCQLEVYAAADAVARIEGRADSPVNRGHLCLKGRYAHRFSRHPDRITTPLIRRDGELVACSWDEAIGVIAAAFHRLRGHLGALSSARCTNEENYLVQKWLRAGLGTNNIDCCARVCHGPTAAGMRRVFGTGAATNSLADIDEADLLLVAGANPTEAHPVTGARLKQAVLRGAKLIVIDPRKTELARMADVHLQLAPGTNVPLLNSLACALLEGGYARGAFVGARTEGFAEYEAFVRRFAPEATESLTGVPAAKVREAARLYGTASRPLQTHGLGMTEHFQGSEGVMLLCNLALIVGAVGRVGVGVNPLRGQNNVQGAADMGCQPDALTGYQKVDDPAVRARFGAVWGRELPAEPGLTIPRMYDAIRRGELRALYILGEDVVQTDPAALWADAFEKLELLVVQELFLTETANRAHVVLPGASFLEKDGTFTNGERRIQRVRKVLEPIGESRADWQTLCALMAATGLPQSFTHPSQIMDEIALVNPSFAGVSYDRLEPNGLQWPVPTVGHPGTPMLHGEAFARGKAAFACVDYVPSPVLDVGSEAGGTSAYPLRLTTGRVLEHYNNGAMTRRTHNADIVARDELELHADDADHYGVRDGEPVRVTSPYGEAVAVACVTDRVAAGTAFLSFHFPETGTNRLMSNVVDRIADCPEYKVTPVRVEPV